MKAKPAGCVNWSYEDASITPFWWLHSQIVKAGLENELHFVEIDWPNRAHWLQFRERSHYTPRLAQSARSATRT